MITGNPNFIGFLNDLLPLPNKSDCQMPLSSRQHIEAFKVRVYADFEP